MENLHVESIEEIHNLIRTFPTPPSNVKNSLDVESAESSAFVADPFKIVSGGFDALFNFSFQSKKSNGIGENANSLENDTAEGSVNDNDKGSIIPTNAKSLMNGLDNILSWKWGSNKN